MNKSLKALGKELIADLLAHAQVVAPREQHWSERLIDSHTLATSTFNRNWLIKGLLVADQPGVIGGAKKMLKTSIMIAMAISIASGKAFLKKFAVPRKIRVAVFTGESGDSTIQETANRICKSENLHLSKLDILWGFDLPQISKREDLETLGKLIREKGIKVIFIDPLYLCLLSGRGEKQDISPSNLYQMGPLLKEVGKVCLDAGATPILVHHCKMGSSKRQQSPELSDLSYSGIQEYVRQWVLIGRRNRFAPGTGHHELWLVAGGSAGQSGEWAFTIREGRISDDFTGRYWKVSFLTPEELAENRKSQKQNKNREKLKKNRKKVLQALKKYPDGETKCEIFKDAKLNSKNGREALEVLVGRGKVEHCEIEKNGKPHPAYRLVANCGSADEERRDRNLVKDKKRRNAKSLKKLFMLKNAG